MAATIEHVRIDHRRAHIRVPEQLLHGANVVTVLEQMRRERMPERMAADPVGNPARKAIVVPDSCDWSD
jgi:hypothetical protein